MTAQFIPVPLSTLQIDASTKVSKAGDTMSGPLLLHADPTASTEAATKNYVDNAAVTATGALPKAGGTMTGAIVLAADPTLPLHPATKEYTDAAVGGAQATASAAGATATAASVTASAALPTAGGTMTGPIVLASDPTLPLHPATKEYVDNAAVSSSALPKAGGTMTGPLVLAADPTLPLHPATKEYTDAAVGVVASTAASATEAAAAAQVSANAAIDNSTDAQAAASSAVDAASNAVVVATAAVPIAGGTMTGPLVLSADPLFPPHATTKRYTDSMIALLQAQISTSLSGLLVKGVWNASTNTPTLTSSVGTQGDTWVVGTAGTTSLNGNASWAELDLAVFASGAWERVPAGSIYGTMALQNANSVAVTDGTATLRSVSLAPTGGSTAGSISNTAAPDDLYSLDTYGAVLLHYSYSSNKWVLGAPITGTSAVLGSVTTSTSGISGGTVGVTDAPDDLYFTDQYGAILGYYSFIGSSWVFPAEVTASSLSATTVALQNVTPSQVTFNVASVQDAALFAADSGNSAAAIFITDKYGAIINSIDGVSGELAHQAGSSTSVPTGLINAGHLKTRMTHKPLSCNTTAGSTGTTYHMVFTIEGLGSLFRIMCINDTGSPPTGVSACIAFPDALGDGKNPTVGGVAIPWRPLTWINGAVAIDYAPQLVAMRAAGFSPPTSVTFPSGGTNTPVFPLSDWIEAYSPARTDGGQGAALVFVRIIATGGTLKLVNNAFGATWDSFLSGRTMQAYEQTGDFVTTNQSGFTSTTRTGDFPCVGIQYESLARGITMMVDSDSVFSGFGSNDGIDYAHRKTAMALSSPSLPVEVANFGTVGQSFTFYYSYGNSVFPWVNPSWLTIEAWSLAGRAETEYGGHVNTIQTQVGGTITPGDVITLTITDAGVLTPPVALSYTVLTGNSRAAVAVGLVALASANSQLNTAGFSAFANGVWCNIVMPDTTATGVVTTSGGATITGTVFNDFAYLTQQAADQSLAGSLAFADVAQAAQCVIALATPYGTIAMTPQTDPTRQTAVDRLRASSSYLILDADALLSTPGIGPGGVPMIPSSLSADNTHPNNAGQALLATSGITPLVVAAFGL